MNNLSLFYKRYTDFINISLLIILSVIVYYNCLNSYFIENDDFSSLLHADRNISTIFTTNTYGYNVSGDYRPIEVLSHQFDKNVYGDDNAFGRHVTNLIMHILNVILVYILAYYLTRKKTVGLIAGLLFSVSIINSSNLTAVSWISGRVDLFVTFFYLVTFILFLQFLSNNSKTLYILSFFTFVLSLMSKEMAITLPVLILLYLLFPFPYYFKKTLKEIFHSIKLASPYFLILFVYIIARFIFLGGIGGHYKEAGGVDVFFKLSPSTFVRDLFGLAGLAWPTGNDFNLSIFNLEINHYVIFYSLFLIFIIFLLFIRFIIVRSRTLSFSFLWIFITVSPAHNLLVSGALYSPRYLYLPAVGFSILIAAVLYKLMQRKNFIPHLQNKIIAPALILFILIVNSILIVRHNEDFVKSGRIAKELVKDLKQYKSEITPNTNLCFITYPISPISPMNNVFAYFAMNEILNYVKSTENNIQEYSYNFLLLLKDSNNSKFKIDWLDKSSFTINIKGLKPDNFFFFPAKVSHLDEKIMGIYGRKLVPHVQPISTNTDLVDNKDFLLKNLKLGEHPDEALKIDLKGILNNPLKHNLFFLYENGHFFKFTSSGIINGDRNISLLIK
jgi:hypothetical protein